MNYLCKFVLFVAYICGIVLAKGFGWTLLALIFPVYSYYLVVKQALMMAGVI